MAFRRSPKLAGATAGASLRFKITLIVMVSTKKLARIMPGTMPPAKSRATDTSCQPA
jgi:hypothetical protein